ncbi:MAG: hypothetical protein CSYNP_02999 [Syntrophus sp. SKADARSKE-3]|nr:hypothetical protein [Syntrophus sp. SKADARSKE-3]
MKKVLWILAVVFQLIIKESTTASPQKRNRKCNDGLMAVMLLALVGRLTFYGLSTYYFSVIEMINYFEVKA